LVKSRSSIPFIAEIVSLFENKAPGSVKQFKARWFYYYDDILERTPKDLNDFKPGVPPKICLHGQISQDSLDRIDSLLSASDITEVFFSQLCDINALETIVEPCHIVFVDERTENVPECCTVMTPVPGSSTSANKTAFFCRYEYLYGKGGLIALSPEKLAEETGVLLRAFQHHDSTIHYENIPEEVARRQFHEVVAESETPPLSQSELDAIEEKTRQDRYGLIRSWRFMEQPQLELYLRQALEHRQPFKKQAAMDWQTPTPLNGKAVTSKEEFTPVSSNCLHDGTANSFQYPPSSSAGSELRRDHNGSWVHDFDHVLVYDIFEDNGLDSSFSALSSPRPDSHCILSSDCSANPTKMESQSSLVAPSTEQTAATPSKAARQSPYLKEKTTEFNSEIRVGERYQAIIPPCASQGPFDSFQDDSDVSYWVDDDEVLTKLWTPRDAAFDELELDRFLTRCFQAVQLIRDDLLRRYREQHAAAGALPLSLQTSEAKGYGSVEALYRKYDLLSGPFPVDGVLLIPRLDLLSHFYALLCGSDYSVEEALRRLSGSPGEELFEVWTHADHMTVVKNGVRKGYGVQHAYRKLPHKSPKAVKDYFFRFVRSAVKLPDSHRLLGESGVASSRVALLASEPSLIATSSSAGLPDDVIASVASFLLRLRRSVDEVTFLEVMNSFVEYLQGSSQSTELVIRSKHFINRSSLTKHPTEVFDPFLCIEEILFELAVLIPKCVTEDECIQLFNSKHRLK